MRPDRRIPTVEEMRQTFASLSPERRVLSCLRLAVAVGEADREPQTEGGAK